jgi:hypothetical protein
VCLFQFPIKTVATGGLLALEPVCGSITTSEVIEVEIGENWVKVERRGNNRDLVGRD